VPVFYLEVFYLEVFLAVYQVEKDGRSVEVN
jgi:hypothetical protein